MRLPRCHAQDEALLTQGSRLVVAREKSLSRYLDQTIAMLRAQISKHGQTWGRGCEARYVCRPLCQETMQILVILAVVALMRLQPPSTMVLYLY